MRKLSKDVRLRVGWSAADFSKGKQFKITQEDKNNDSLLADFGGGFVDWFSRSFIEEISEVMPNDN